MDQHPVDVTAGERPEEAASVVERESTAGLAGLEQRLHACRLPFVTDALELLLDAARAGEKPEVPPGVTGYVGWANRLLFMASYVWTALAARAVLKAAG